MATTLGDIITDIRNRADLTYSEFISNEELTSYINYSLGELQALIVNSYGGDYYFYFFTGSVADGQIFTSQFFPDDCYKILGVDLVLGGNATPPAVSNNRITLQPFNFNERNRANSLNLQGYATQYSTNYRYSIKESLIMLQPPAVGQVDLLVWYVPAAPQFLISNPVDLTQQFLPQTNLANWLEYVIVDVCIKCKQKEETDTSMFVRQKALLTERIRNEANNRDQGSPASVSDVYAQGVVTDAGWQYGWWGYDWNQ